MSVTRPGLRALTGAALSFWAGCGYFESVYSPVAPSETVLSGRVADRWTHEGIQGATVTLQGTGRISVSSSEGGIFQFPDATTGSKTLDISAAGYRPYSRALDLKLSLRDMDTIFLDRVNRRPKINSVDYPVSGDTGAPLTISFEFTLSDSDYAAALSSESLFYRFYLGGGTNPPAVDSGPVPAIAGTLSPVKLFVPRTPFFRLATNTSYRWRLVVVDLYGDSAVHPLDSFTTRAALAPCDSGMALVEVKSKAVCVDSFEFTNEQYLFYEAVFNALAQTDSLLDSLPPRFDDPISLHEGPLFPVNYVELFSAESLCWVQGKRLCTIDEWKTAVSGYKGWAYPYGAAYDSTKCRTDTSTYAGYANEIGINDSCVSPFGIYDLSGNLAEWVRFNRSLLYYHFDNDGFPVKYFIGGNWASKSRSGTNSLDSTGWPFRADIGFRCCRDGK